jgi:hypothetical protein
LLATANNNKKNRARAEQFESMLTRILTPEAKARRMCELENLLLLISVFGYVGRWHFIFNNTDD